MNTKIDKSNIKFRFGKYKDQLVSDILKTDAKYLAWYCKTTSFDNDKKIISEMLTDNTKLKI